MNFEEFVSDLETVVKNNEKYLLIPKIRQMMKDLGYKKKVDLLQFSVEDLFGLRKRLNNLIIDRIAFLEKYEELDVPFDENFIIQEQEIVDEFLEMDMPGYQTFVPEERKVKENISEMNRAMINGEFDLDSYVEKRRREYDLRKTLDKGLMNLTSTGHSGWNLGIPAIGRSFDITSRVFLDMYKRGTSYEDSFREVLFRAFLDREIDIDFDTDYVNLFTNSQIKVLNKKYAIPGDPYPAGKCWSVLMEYNDGLKMADHYLPRLDTDSIRSILFSTKFRLLCPKIMIFKYKSLTSGNVHYTLSLVKRPTVDNYIIECGPAWKLFGDEIELREGVTRESVYLELFKRSDLEPYYRNGELDRHDIFFRGITDKINEHLKLKLI